MSYKMNKYEVLKALDDIKSRAEWASGALTMLGAENVDYLKIINAIKISIDLVEDSDDDDFEVVI